MDPQSRSIPQFHMGMETDQKVHSGIQHGKNSKN
jgi:hypothetical protein